MIAGGERIDNQGQSETNSKRSSDFFVSFNCIWKLIDFGFRLCWNADSHLFF